MIVLFLIRMIILLKLKDAKAKTDAHEAGVQAAIRFVQDNKSIIKRR